MKLTNKLLEAINRGIQLALDDFDDEEQVQNIKSKQVQNRDYTKEYLDLMEEVVDLDLPSKTLWCKHNLGVNPNQLSKPEDWYGDYYAWGELKPNKPEFNWDNYKFGRADELTKYNTNEQYAAYFDGESEIDNLTKLQPEDDAAYQNKKFYSFKFHIPTKEQCEELMNYTKNYWVKNYDPNKTIHDPENDGGIQGLNGQIFEGKNGNQLFIPAAGFRFDSDINNVGSLGDLWSSSLYVDDPSCAFDFYINPVNIDMSYDDRCDGMPIRPVINL